jgi:hypothetical protein
MYEHPLEDIHRLIDTIEVAIKQIEAAPIDSLQVNQYPAISEVVLELLGWTNTAYMENELGINPSVLSKFVKMRGVVRKTLARKVADKLRSYLKSQDQAFSPPPIDKQKRPTPFKEIAPVSISGEQWIAVKFSSEVKMKIGAVSALLDSIIEQTSRSNAPEEDQILTQIERQQLIAILETALNVLRSPLAEKGILKRARSALQRGAQSAVEREVQQGLGKLMEAAGGRIGITNKRNSVPFIFIRRYFGPGLPTDPTRSWGFPMAPSSMLPIRFQN